MRMRHRSLGFFVNQAGHVADGEAPDPAARPNVKYTSARPKDGGLVFALQALEDIPAGAELLANYEDNERVSGMRAGIDSYVKVPRVMRHRHTPSHI